MPLTRELLMLAGGNAVTKESFYSILSANSEKESKGNVVVVVVGGASEALESKSDIYRIILKKRKESQDFQLFLKKLRFGSPQITSMIGNFYFFRY